MSSNIKKPRLVFLIIFAIIVTLLSYLKKEFSFPNFKESNEEKKLMETTIDSIEKHAIFVDNILMSARQLSSDLKKEPSKRFKHRILSVSSFEKTFPDLNDVQLATAKKIGISPIADREIALKMTNKEQLVFVGASPFYYIKTLHNSIPYLVPRAQQLLDDIARNFFDSLLVKNIKPSRIIVTSLTRTKEDVKQLQKHNPNATTESCHCRGTSFDISYSKYHNIQDPDLPKSYQTGDDTLKWVLSEVLRDERVKGTCYIKYEIKQGCFHITVR